MNLGIWFHKFHEGQRLVWSGSVLSMVEERRGRGGVGHELEKRDGDDEDSFELPVLCSLVLSGLMLSCRVLFCLVMLCCVASCCVVLSLSCLDDQGR